MALFMVAGGHLGCALSDAVLEELLSWEAGFRLGLHCQRSSFVSNEGPAHVNLVDKHWSRAVPSCISKVRHNT